MAIFVMLNNFFHDFAAALLFSSLITLSFIYRYLHKKDTGKNILIFRQLYGYFKYVLRACWIFIIIGGVIRTIYYFDYEWMEAAGKGQISALVIKHILLVTIVVWGVIIQLKLKKQLSGFERNEVNE